MTPRADLSATTLTVRTEPVQQRSTDRITNLLDSAASLIDQHGIDGLTTSDVATSSGSSVGVVYRYFPNIQSLLRALAARNLERFIDSIHDVAGVHSTDWATAADAIIDAYAALSRTEPGFRAVRFGEVIDERFIQPDVGTTTSISRRFTDLLVSNYGFAASEALSYELEVMVEIGDALLHRAFQYDHNGDDRFIATLRTLVRERLSPIAP
ncbi:MAG: TetR family transcriptional regulator [Rhodoglobus sp.]|nr:TetR family transcriptional regulator [Rhodoglobus sp.]